MLTPCPSLCPQLLAACLALLSNGLLSLFNACLVPACSMRGARETVAKALALECMRAAKAQERGCYVFAFAGPQEVGGPCPLHGDHWSGGGPPALPGAVAPSWALGVLCAGKPSLTQVCCRRDVHVAAQPGLLSSVKGFASKLYCDKAVHTLAQKRHAQCGQVRELELNMDLKSVNNLLDFLEKTFNGGSDFNAPVKRCLDRLTDAKWANSDILLVGA